ncbi:MAG: phage tail protein [Alphaproteobacteria bacterium]|nr:phage tail protein [Alphaproteobacteria bacterium]
MAFRDDPYGAHYFGLMLKGQQNGGDLVEVAHFHECSGLKSAAQVFEIEEGGLNGRTHKRPGQSRWENIVLRTSTHTSMELLEWRDQFLQDNWRDRRDGAIIMYNEAGDEIRRFNFRNGWPVSWEGPNLKSGASELAVETLEVAHEGLDINDTQPTPPPAPPEEVPEKLDLPQIPFEYDSDVITPEGLAVIAQASQDMDRMNIDEIWLEGHTSTSGSFSYNADLAQRRADAVKEELAKHNPDRKVYTQSFGWKYPVASNSTASGMAANRRTDFYTTSYASRGRDASPIQPENRKYDPPYNHRDTAAAAEKSGQ